MKKRLKPEHWTSSQLSDYLENQRSQHYKPREFSSIYDDVKTYVKKLRLLSKNKRHLLTQVWNFVTEQINPEIRESTEVLSFRGGVLKITVTSPTLLFELEHFYREKLITEIRANSKFTVIKIVFEIKR